MSRPEIVEESSTGTTSLLKLRYEFTGHLDPIAKKLLGNRKLTWLQELHFDMAMLRGRLTFAAEADPNRLNGEAAVTLEADDDATTRHIAGDLHVRVPLIGGKAERSIVPWHRAAARRRRRRAGRSAQSPGMKRASSG